MRTIALSLLAATLLATAPGVAADGPPPEVQRGAEVYERCVACHALDRNRTGPKHCGVVGRRAASVAGYAYSDALGASGLVWTPEALDRFLAAPLDVVPGTTMGYAGVADAAERRALIGYLAWAAEHHPACR